MEKKKISLVGMLKKSIKLFLIILYTTFLIVLSFGTVVAGIWTVMPAEASKANYIGYYSTCAFAPFSTIILFSLALVGFLLLLKLQKSFRKKSRNNLAYMKYNTITSQK